MERGIVKFVSVNPRGNRYGFVRTASGDVYFNQWGRSFVPVVEDGRIRFGNTWAEVLRGKRFSSPFPQVGQVLYLECEDRNLVRPEATWWATEHFLRQLEAQLARA